MAIHFSQVTTKFLPPTKLPIVSLLMDSNAHPFSISQRLILRFVTPKSGTARVPPPSFDTNFYNVNEQ